MGKWDPTQARNYDEYPSPACPFKRGSGLGRQSPFDGLKLSEPSVLGRGEDQSLSIRLSKEKPNPLQHPISLGGVASGLRDKCSIKIPNPTRFVEEAEFGKCGLEFGEDFREEEFLAERYASHRTIPSFSFSLLDQGYTLERLFGRGVHSIDEERELNGRGTPIFQTPLRVVMSGGEGEENMLLSIDLVVKEDT